MYRLNIFTLYHQHISKYSQYFPSFKSAKWLKSIPMLILMTCHKSLPSTWLCSHSRNTFGFNLVSRSLSTSATCFFSFTVHLPTARIAHRRAGFLWKRLSWLESETLSNPTFKYLWESNSHTRAWYFSRKKKINYTSTGWWISIG